MTSVGSYVVSSRRILRLEILLYEFVGIRRVLSLMPLSYLVNLRSAIIICNLRNFQKEKQIFQTLLSGKVRSDPILS